MMYKEPPTFHLSPTPKDDGLVLVYVNGLLQQPQKPMNPGSGDYYLSQHRNKIHFQPTSRLQVGDNVIAVYESRAGWVHDSVVIK